MKKILHIAFLFPLVLNAQIQTTKNKTTHLFFPKEITYWDIGKGSFVGGQIVDNILTLKSKIDYSEETNVTIRTKDNLIYSFTLNHVNNLADPNYIITELQAKNYVPKDSLEYKKTATTFSPEDVALYILNNYENFRPLKVRRYNDISYSLMNVFIYDDVYYLDILLTNYSMINYDIDYLKIKTASRSGIKRRNQEEEYLDFSRYPKENRIPADGELRIIKVLDKFTIRASKMVEFEIAEINGERNFIVPINHKLLLNALKLPYKP